MIQKSTYSEANYLADPGLPTYTKNFGGIRYCDLENNGGAH
jgi:hypothetical protein